MCKLKRAKAELELFYTGPLLGSFQVIRWGDDAPCRCHKRSETSRCISKVYSMFYIVFCLEKAASCTAGGKYRHGQG